MSAPRPVGPPLEELRARLMVELRGHPLLTRGAVVMRSDLATALGIDAEAVELLIAQAVSAGHLAGATWLAPTDGTDAALVALLPPADARLVPGVGRGNRAFGGRLAGPAQSGTA